MRGPGPPDGGRPRGPSPIGELGQADAKALIARVDRPLATRLGILDHQEADIGQPELAGIENLDGDDLASSSEPRQCGAPGVDGSDEVRDHDGEPASAQDVAKSVDRSTEIDLPAER